ncbi:glycosyltransferase family 2 protein [Roseivivax sp. CAU 1753]
MRWGVTATVAEPPALLAAFAAHYAHLGAAAIRLYLDRPDPAVARLLATVPGVEVIDADAAFYVQSLGCRTKPGALNRKQRFNADHALETMDVDWLLHVDADEFLAAGDFAAELCAVPDDVDSLHIPNGERAWLAGARSDTIFDGVLRWPIPGPPRRVRRILGDEVARFTDRGFCGHMWGKSVTRTGRGLKLGLHKPRRDPPARQIEASEAQLCHFDGLTRAHWVSKLLRYARLGMYAKPVGPHRCRHEQVAFVQAAGSDASAGSALHDKVRIISATDAAAWQEAGWLAPMPCDPAAATRLYFGDSVDLSPAAFDAILLN